MGRPVQVGPVGKDMGGGRGVQKSMGGISLNNREFVYTDLAVSISKRERMKDDLLKNRYTNPCRSESCKGIIYAKICLSLKYFSKLSFTLALNNIYFGSPLHLRCYLQRPQFLPFLL